MTVQVNYSPSNGIVGYLGNTKYTSHKVVQNKEGDQLSVTQIQLGSLTIAGITVYETTWWLPHCIRRQG